MLLLRLKFLNVSSSSKVDWEGSSLILIVIDDDESFLGYSISSLYGFAGASSFWDISFSSLMQASSSGA